MAKKANNHEKPTDEEMDSKIQGAVDADPDKDSDEETPEDKDKRVKKETEEELEPKDEDEDTEVDGESGEEGEQEDETPEETPDEEQAEPSKEKFKRQVKEKDKKLSASARENQKIYAKNRVMNKALIEADDIPEPTEEEMKTKYGDDWEMFSPAEKEDKKEIAINRKWREVLAKAKDQGTKIEKWTQSVDDFVDDPKTLIDNPELEDRTAEFREFALAEANNSIPFDILVPAFLHKREKSKVSNKGKMFEKGHGGPNTKPKPKDGKLTIEEGAQLKKVNYSKYKEKLIAGMIEDDI